MSKLLEIGSPVTSFIKTIVILMFSAGEAKDAKLKSTRKNAIKRDILFIKKLVIFVKILS